MLNFEELHENVLLEICKYLNKEAKINLMLTSKLFYNLIAQNVNLCKDFRLDFEGEHYDPEIRNCGRFINTIIFSKYSFNEENFAVILELFTKIGFGIKVIRFIFGYIDKHQLYQLMRLVPNLENLSITFLKLRKVVENEELPRIAHRFHKLKSLFLDTGFGSVFTHIFQDSVGLEHLTLYHSYEILTNKSKLKFLRIGSNDDIDFDIILKDKEIKLEELHIDNLDIKPGKAFQNFWDFIETQKQIKKFYFNYCDGPISEFTLILIHILNLETLESVETGINDVLKYMPANRIRNENVKTLLIDRGMYIESNIIAHYFRLFPALTSLQLHPFSLQDESLFLINNLSTLEELNIVGFIEGFVSKDTIEQLNIRNLKKFLWSGYPFQRYDAETFNIFTQNHPNITEFTLKLSYWIGLDVLEVIVKNLKQLKRLTINDLHTSVFDLDDRIFEVVGENAKCLEYLELDLSEKYESLPFIIRAIEYFKLVLPKLKYSFLY